MTTKTPEEFAEALLDHVGDFGEDGLVEVIRGRDEAIRADEFAKIERMRPGLEQARDMTVAQIKRDEAQRVVGEFLRTIDGPERGVPRPDWLIKLAMELCEAWESDDDPEDVAALADVISSGVEQGFREWAAVQGIPTESTDTGIAMTTPKGGSDEQAV